jgi:ribosomal protein S12
LPGDDKSQAVKIATPHKQVLIQGGGPRDLPGVHYKLIRGWPSISILSKILTPPRRKSRRAKYGIKNHTRTLQVRLRIKKKRIVIKKKLFN